MTQQAPKKSFGVEKSIKLVDLNLKNSKNWQTTVLEIDHPHDFKKKVKQRVFTASYRLPINFLCVANIVINGVVVYDCGASPKCSYVIGGGGRFEVRRRFYDGELVAVELLLKDVCCYSSRKPSFKVIVEVEEETV